MKDKNKEFQNTSIDLSLLGENIAWKSPEIKCEFPGDRYQCNFNSLSYTYALLYSQSILAQPSMVRPMLPSSATR